MYSNKLLTSKDSSLLIIKDRPNKNIVISSPHHSPLGISKIPCKMHRNGDEATGFLSDYIANEIECCSVIASNYFIDANKSVSYDYFRIIEKWSPKNLIEIHGHGGKSAVFDIEISCGNINDNKKSIRLADALQKELSDTILSSYSISGDYNKIYFTAQYSVSITTEKWTSYHIELPNSIRTTEKKAKLFCTSLIKVIKSLGLNE